MASIINVEILQIAEAVAREKNISKDTIISVIEEAIQLVGKNKYGLEHNIKAEINNKTGEIKLYRVLDVVEEVKNTFTQISLINALELNPSIAIGEQLFEKLPPIDLGRVSAQTAKYAIVQKVKEIERKKQYLDFKDRVGEIINGIVRRVEQGNIIVDLGKAEAVILKDQTIKSETYKIHDRIKAYIQRVSAESKGPLIFLSRTDNQMLVKLLASEVTEIYNNIIQVKAVARDPGSKAKVAVFSSDVSIDAVGSCIGVRGNRIKNIRDALGGENIDVVKWSDDIAQFAVNAIAHAQITKVIIDEEKHLIEMVVPADQLSVAIGRHGQNVKLASKLVGWNIDIITEEQESLRRTDEFNTATNLFIQHLEVEEIIAQLLVAEGFTNIEQVANTDINILASINGFNLELASELKDRAVKHINNQNEGILAKLEEQGVEQDLLEALVDIPFASFITLAENGVKTLEDLRELKLEEFRVLVPDSRISDEEFYNIISNKVIKK